MNLRGLRVLISVFPFPIPLFVYFCVSPCLSYKPPTHYFKMPSPYCIIVVGYSYPWMWQCSGCVNENFKQRSSPQSAIGKENRRVFTAGDVSVFTGLSCQWPPGGSATWLWSTRSRPYSQYKHVRAKCQGDRLSKVSQGQCCLKEMTHTVYRVVVLNHCFIHARAVFNLLNI